MEFKSQICTTREQSKRLLSMGLKPETADMYMDQYGLSVAFPYGRLKGHRDERDIAPAWSLSRLLELLPSEIPQSNRPDWDLEILPEGKLWHIRYTELGHDMVLDTMGENIFEAVVNSIDWLIDLGYFNEEYLKSNEQKLKKRMPVHPQ